MISKLSLMSVHAIGKNLADKKKFTPKFTVEDFKKGAEKFGEYSANDFIEYCNKIFSTKEYDFKSIKALMGQENEVRKEHLYEALYSKGSVVLVKDTKVVGKWSYKELIAVLEYGRKDKGVLPDPVIREAFDSYRPTYKKNVKKFLLGKL